MDYFSYALMLGIILKRGINLLIRDLVGVTLKWYFFQFWSSLNKGGWFQKWGVEEIQYGLKITTFLAS